MLKQKRAKMSRQRGNSSHGWGHKKKHRGSGHRGGFGFSGTGSRGDQRKSAVLSRSKSFFKMLSARKGIKMEKISKDYVHFGKKGFIPVKKEKISTLSLNYIENHFDKMVEQGLILKEKNDFVFDATTAGIDKILGRGQFTKKITVTVEDISASAKQRIEDAGGKVILAYEDDFEKETSEE